MCHQAYNKSPDLVCYDTISSWIRPKTTENGPLLYPLNMQAKA